MASYNTLKSNIAAYVKQNGVGAITGNGLQGILNQMVNSLGNKYQFVGVAQPNDNPGTPDYNVAYLAGTQGIYPNFGNNTVAANQICILKYNGSWAKEVLIDIPSGTQLEVTNITDADFSLVTDPDSGEDWWVCRLSGSDLQNKYIIVTTPSEESGAAGCSLELAPMAGQNGNFCIFCENTLWGLSVGVNDGTTRFSTFSIEQTQLGVVQGTVINGDCYPLSFSIVNI